VFSTQKVRRPFSDDCARYQQIQLPGNKKPPKYDIGLLALAVVVRHT